MTKTTLTDDLHLLVGALPPPLQQALPTLEPGGLLEIVMDLGRPPQARFPGRAVELADKPVTRGDLDHVVAAVGEFSADNRAGIEGTLHRISAMRNRRGEIVGLTLRVGRAVLGTIDLIQDLVESGRSILLLGRPGVGKTTKLRETARLLADDLGKRVIVIDTSNEIGGDGDVPHPAIGGARRMQVPHASRQHAVMIEAVENHMPEVIVVDEIGTEAEAMAARTIAERGVQLIGTAHGTSLENLLVNPTLSDLVGGVQTVILGDEEARLRGTQKTISERKAAPSFDAVVEIVAYDRLIVHADTAAAVDRLLRSQHPRGVERTPAGETATAPERPPLKETVRPVAREPDARTMRLYPYAISRDSVDKAIRELRVEARTVNRPERADAIVALRSRSEDGRLRRIIETTGLPLHLVKKNTTAQIRRLLQDVFAVVPGSDRADVEAALGEARAGVDRAISEGVAVELAPQPARLRRLQHRIVVRRQLMAESIGSEPRRHLVIHPAGSEAG
ncbi:MAG: AAA family ATPase [Gammaproteobacteria bacterium]|nr:AAA family ATPase [Gammaproteobacteria bacterium]